MSLSNKESGFTLLEVMVALTITGLALGGLFSIVGGSKQLAWRSEKVLLEVMHMRGVINSSQLNDGLGVVNLEFVNDDNTIVEGVDFEIPERQTQASQFALRRYEILDANNESRILGSYWVELEFPE